MQVVEIRGENLCGRGGVEAGQTLFLVSRKEPKSLPLYNVSWVRNISKMLLRPASAENPDGELTALPQTFYLNLKVETTLRREGNEGKRMKGERGGKRKGRGRKETPGQLCPYPYFDDLHDPSG